MDRGAESAGVDAATGGPTRRLPLAPAEAPACTGGGACVGGRARSRASKATPLLASAASLSLASALAGRTAGCTDEPCAADVAVARDVIAAIAKGVRVCWWCWVGGWVDGCAAVTEVLVVAVAVAAKESDDGGAVVFMAAKDVAPRATTFAAGRSLPLLVRRCRSSAVA